MSATPTEDVRSHLTRLLARALERAVPERAEAAVVLERPKHDGHGDYACNIAMQLAKAAKRAPRVIAGQIIAELPQSDILDRAEVAGAGFINLYLRRDYKQRAVQRVLTAGATYGRLALGRYKRVQVEFVSANPTGPLHVGHGRGAAYGASLANVLDAAGFQVAREFYVNDAGRQMDILTVSTWLRYLEDSGVAAPFPANGYQGAYVRDMASELRARNGERLVHGVTGEELRSAQQAADEEAALDGLIAFARKRLGSDYGAVLEFVLSVQLADCRADLEEFGVSFDNWFSERSLHESGRVEQAVRMLEEQGHVYLQGGAKWFRSSAFGDEKDRVVRRENGQFTYFASDIAYHADKFARGFDVMIDVWGADHHGYIARVKGALAGLGLDPGRLTVALVQFAVLYRNRQKVPMSTRAGEFVTLRELRREVGADAARFFYLLRKSDQHLDFDLDLAKSQSNENPVYYVQYAHARICSVLAQWGGNPACLVSAEWERLESAHEQALLARLMEYPEIVESAAQELSPHVIAFYLRDLTAGFHSYYNASRILVDDEPVRLARLALIAAVRQVLCNGLALLGVSAPEKM